MQHLTTPNTLLFPPSNNKWHKYKANSKLHIIINRLLGIDIPRIRLIDELGAFLAHMKHRHMKKK